MTRDPKPSAQVVQFPKQPRPLSLSALPKRKQRWLREVARKLFAQQPPEDARRIATILVTSVGAAFAGNRRGEFTQDEVHAWLQEHRRDAARIAFDLVSELDSASAEEVRRLVGWSS